MNWSVFFSTFAGVFLGEFLWGVIRREDDEDC